MIQLCNDKKDNAAGVAISSDSDLEIPHFVPAPDVDKDVSFSEGDTPCLSPNKLRRIFGKQPPPFERVPDVFNIAAEPELDVIPQLTPDGRRFIKQKANHAARVATEATRAGSGRTKKKGRKAN